MNLPKLTTAEENAMHLLWEIERGTVSDVLERLPESERPPHSTMSSVVRILEKKGYVGHKSYGKTHEYFPLIKKEEYGSRNLKDLLKNYFGGSVEQMVSHLVRAEEISPEALTELMQKLEEND